MPDPVTTSAAGLPPNEGAIITGHPGRSVYPADELLERGQRVEGDQAVVVAQAWGSKRVADVVAARRSKSLGCKITEHTDGYWECHACGDCGFLMEDDDA